MRLSARLTEIYGISRRNAKQYIHDGRITLNGVIIRKDIDVSGDCEPVADIRRQTEEASHQAFLIAEKNDILFFYKPPFMHTERHTPEDETTLSDLVPATHRLVSRLDYETDGIIAAVANELEIKTIGKKYYAAVRGVFPQKIFMENDIDASKRKKVKVLESKGVNPVTFSLFKQINDISIVQAELKQAHRHQLRAYLAYAGFPIIGDKLYGGENFPRLMLHCGYTFINETEETSGKLEKFYEYLSDNI